MRRGSFKLLSKCCYRPIRWKSSAANPAIFNLILDDLHSTLMVEENFAYIVIYDQNQTKRMFSYATYLMLIHTLLCWLSGQRVLLNQIQLKCAAPLDDFDYKVRFVSRLNIRPVKTISSLMQPICSSQ